MASEFWERLHERRMSRRAMLNNSAKVGVGAAGLALVACGDDDDDDDAPAAPPPPPADDTPAPPSIATYNNCPSFEAPFAGIMAHMFVAEELGFYEEEGIKEEFTYQTACANLIAAGATDIALLDTPEVLNALEQGRNFKAVMQPWYKLIFGVFVPDDSPIQSWNADDLRGQGVGITEFAGGEVPVVRALLSQIGLTEGEDVELIPTSGLPGQQPTIDAFNSGQIVAFGGGRHDVFSVELGGLKMRDVTPPEILAIFASEALTVRGEVLEDAEQTDILTRYLRGYNKGLVFLQESVEAAADIALDVAPESGSLEETIDLLNLFFIGVDPPGHRNTPPPGTQFGEVPVEGWNDFQLLLLDGRTGTEVDPLTFDEPIDVNEVIDNSLIPEINNFDKERIRQMARDYVI